MSLLWVTTIITTLISGCVCGKTFTVEMSFPCGGFPSIRHNELQDTISFI